MSTDTGWFSKIVFCAALITLILLPVSALGHKFGLFGLVVAFGLLRVCLLGGLAVIIAGVINILIGKQKENTERVMQAWLSIVIALVPVGVMGYQISKATGVPPIHNISTDVTNPPEFYRAAELRGEQTNPISYGSQEMPREKLVELQQTAYPDVQSIHSALSLTESFDKALSVINSYGFEIINEDRGRGVIEAVDTTFWYGFKDDLVVRVQAEEGGTVIDLRSVSRVGQSDLGKNSARILRFIKDFSG